MTFSPLTVIVTETPLGQIPVLYTAEGEINQSTSIARYAAKKLGKTSQ